MQTLFAITPVVALFALGCSSSDDSHSPSAQDAGATTPAPTGSTKINDPAPPRPSPPPPADASTLPTDMDPGAPQCDTQEDCVELCPEGAKSCACMSSPMGKVCVPTCTTAADCKIQGAPPLTCQAGACVPGRA